MTTDCPEMISHKRQGLSIEILALICANLIYASAQVNSLAPVACDDKSVEKLARLSVTYINEDRQSGYKFALNRITNVQLHAQGPAGKVYYLNADVLETKCHVKSPKPWKRCDVRPFMETQISGNCNITILHDAEGFSYLFSYDCMLVPDPPEKLQKTCPDCPLLLDDDNPEAISAAQLSFLKYRAQLAKELWIQSTQPVNLAFHAVTRASRQHGKLKRTFVEFTIAECPEGTHASGICLKEDAAREPVGFCAGDVVGNSWFSQYAKVSCELFDPQRYGLKVDVNVKPVSHDVTPTHPSYPDPSDVNIPEGAPDPYPFQPVNPYQPSKPVSPYQPSLPVSPYQPSQPVSPYQPRQPVSPYQPSQPAAVPDDRLSDPMQPAPLPLPEQPAAISPPRRAASSSESRSSSESDSSEEIVGVTIARPPAGFRYKPYRRKRLVPLFGTKPPHTPVFMSVFPSGMSPFRSCPGPSRFTTV